MVQDPVDIHFFWSDGCPHCDKEKIFLDEIEASYGDLINVNRYEVRHNQANQAFLQELSRESNIQVTGVPAIFIDDEVVIGFESIETTGVEIKYIIDSALANLGSEEKENSTEKETISVPFLGTIDSTTYTLEKSALKD